MCSTEENTSDHRIEEELTCRFCQEIFPNFSELLEHKKDCASRNRVVFDQNSAPSEGEIEEDEEEEPEESEDCGKRKEEVRRQKQDAENNNSVDDGETEGEEGEIPLPYPFPLPAAAAPGHVTLEALQNTKVAVAQFAATALANGTDNPAALQELAVLQSTLYTLQHQQILQLNLIQQLQDQLQINRPPGELSATGSPPPPVLPLPLSLNVTPPVTSTPAPLSPPPIMSPSITTSIAATTTASPTTTSSTIPPKPSRSPTPIKQEPLPQSVTPPASQSIPATNSQPQTVPIPPRPQLPTCTPPPPPPPTTCSTSSLPHCSISSSFASSIITNLDPSSPNEPNTLEMLQRRAQEVLDNASQGLLANNLADELAFRKNGGKGSLSPYDSKSGRNEPFFKHRCRYCGKVFGSDSALQIHIRSHTGERPFKCNVCGSRFTTKGNLKVHFQRHTSKFPHIKMNPHPVPEHLDKYHPPLLAQINSQPPHHPHPPYPTSPPYTSPSLPVFRPSQHELVLPPHHPPLHRPHEPLIKPLLPMPLFGPREREDQDMPENLSKPVSSIHSSPPPSSDLSDKCKRESIDEEPLNMSEASGSVTNENMSRLSPKTEPDVDGDSEHEQEQDRYPSPPPYDGCSVSSKYSTEDMMIGDEDSGDESLTDQPENLSNKRPDDSSNSPHQVPSFSTSLAALENQVRTMSTTPPPPVPINGTSSPYSMTPSPPSSQTPVHLTIPRPIASSSSPDSSSLGALDLTPRSGSGMFSGIGLVTSVNSPISQYSPLGLAVGPAVRGGNTTCNICFKTFACHSALEIHYRSHTKERPFKCTICERGFSTKGNMKQHMLTHKIRDMPSHMFHTHSHASQDTKSSSGVLSTEETSNASSMDSFHARSMTSEPPRDREATRERTTSEARQSDAQSPEPLSLNLSNSSQRSQPHTPQSHHSLSPPAPTPTIPQPPTVRPSLSPPAPKRAASPSPAPQPPPSLKRTSPDDRDHSSVPLPKRHPMFNVAGMPKHLCHVCHKNFSSSSALQIHMRTHTGDKPFRCTICQKAFTTKGNLKVHMGTHMWTNGASRRGRRMSLDLPPHLTPSITPKEPSEFLNRRPVLFYPYLPAPFLNGMQQKLNEISVIQNVTSNMSNGLINFTSTFGSASLPESLKRSLSPDKPLSPGAHHRGTSPLWGDKNGTGNHSDDQIDVGPSPRLSQREGLAA
ncbi:sal-like protein 1 [Diaphorina citri]|uniref:Sal-like protein 1 n=1 Tax=Diaphorina citri TaxID=121845 RepID=A0A3Q0IXI7_DIACI|nr:sal-like protein 1 [Diaphorina citri]